MTSTMSDKFGGDEPIGIAEANPCKTCQKCCFQHPDPEHANDFDYKKAICMIYTFDRGLKPTAVMDDEEPCDYFSSMDEILKENPS